MNINLITDAKYHSLALMKYSTFYKLQGHNIYLNGVGSFDLTVGSFLFTESQKGVCDIEGGPGVDPTIRHDLDSIRPDYSLFGLNYSLGYTWEYCPRKCPFCVVPRMNPPKKHSSIWEFHDSKFKIISLLNNNTFSDPQWRETFEEIWDADLIVRDDSGYDLRLLDEEKAEALKRTRFRGYIHYAWDSVADETKIIHGLRIASKGIVYVLVGYDSTIEDDLYRCQKIHDMGHDPYIMPFTKGKYERSFQRFINTRMYRKYPNIEEAWRDYKK